jgi:hypothetical protein
MWLFTRYGFFSIACGRAADGSVDPQTIMIRGRRKAHLEALQSRFPAIAAVRIVTLVERDYRYRLIVAKTAWVAVMTALAEEQEWSNFKNEAARFRGSDGSAYVNALHRVWDVMYGLQRSERQRTLIERSPDGVITNAADLTADDLSERKVLCPACNRKLFVSWPEGWDAHAAHACEIDGATAEERKANFKQRFLRLFR